MIEIEFHNREKEIQEILRILNSRPDLITFVYGPINSGKSSLMDEIVKKLPDDYVVFYIDLRGRFIVGYEDFLKVLFEAHRTKVRDYKRFISKALEGVSFSGIPIPKDLLVELLKEKETEDVFEYVLKVLSSVRRKGKIPILILDELQVIGDLKIDDLLIYRLFNFFITITKRLHLAHVFAVTSDSLFIERVYSEAMLQGRCNYLLVDDFDYETTKGFLKKYGFNKKEIELVWNYFGGKPVYLVEAIKNRHNLKEFCEERLEERFSIILYSLRSLEDEDKKLFRDVVNLLSEFREKEVVKCDKISSEVIWTVKQNILFLNPRKRLLKPQSKLDLLAIKRILEVIEG